MRSAESMSPKVANRVVLALFGATAVGLTVGVVMLARPVTTTVVVILGICVAATAITLAVVLERDSRRRPPAQGAAKREDRRTIWVMLLGIAALPVLEFAGRLTKLAVVTIADALMLGILALLLVRMRRRT